MSQHNSLMAYLNRHPPVQRMLEAFFGIAGSSSGRHHPADDPDTPTYANESFESLMMRWGGTPGLGRGH